jgi:hypothetical protein
MTATVVNTNYTLDYKLLEKEWFSLSSPQQKADFWERMNDVFKLAPKSEIADFFNQLYLDTKNSTERLQLAKERAKLAGYIITH